MCRPVRCKQCGKTTWSGCGHHIAAVKASVPAGLWCPGHTEPGNAPDVGFIGRLFGR